MSILHAPRKGAQTSYAHALVVSSHVSVTSVYTFGCMKGLFQVHICTWLRSFGLWALWNNLYDRFPRQIDICPQPLCCLQHKAMRAPSCDMLVTIAMHKYPCSGYISGSRATIIIIKHQVSPECDESLYACQWNYVEHKLRTADDAT